MLVSHRVHFVGAGFEANFTPHLFIWFSTLISLFFFLSSFSLLSFIPFFFVPVHFHYSLLPFYCFSLPIPFIPLSLSSFLSILLSYFLHLLTALSFFTFSFSLFLCCFPPLVSYPFLSFFFLTFLQKFFLWLSLIVFFSSQHCTEPFITRTVCLFRVRSDDVLRWTQSKIKNSQIKGTSACIKVYILNT